MNKNILSANNKIYKSFEQWKAETFPKLSKEEARNADKTDMKKTGVILANASFDNLLSRL